MIEILVSVIAFIIVFSILVLAHEFGHFIAAKKSGVTVKEFGLGLPPRAITLWTDKSGTRYSLNWIPFGGFVHMLGEDIVPPDANEMKDPSLTGEQRRKLQESLKALKDPKSFINQPLWKRLGIIVAGVSMNFVLAIIALTIVFTAGFYPLAVVEDEKIPINSYVIERESFAREHNVLIIDTNVTGVTIEKVEPSSQAARAGLEENDIIVSIDGEKVDNALSVVNTTKDSVGKTILFAVQRGAQELQVPITPEKNKPVGIYLKPQFTINEVRFPFPESFLKATEEVIRQSYITVLLAKNLVMELIQKMTVPEGVAGPVGIAQMTNTFVKMGIIPLLIFLAMISISLGVLNIMPFPALDGGKLLFLLFELITRKKPNAHIEATIHTVGFALLMLLLLAITWNDIMRPFQG